MLIASILALVLILIGALSFGWGSYSLFVEIADQEEMETTQEIASWYFISLTGLGLANFSLGILIGLQRLLSTLLI